MNSSDVESLLLKAIRAAREKADKDSNDPTNPKQRSLTVVYHTLCQDTELARCIIRDCTLSSIIHNYFSFERQKLLTDNGDDIDCRHHIEELDETERRILKELA